MSDNKKIEVLEHEYKPATKWQHELDEQLHTTAKEKVWCDKIISKSELCFVEFKQVKP
ncbi:MAG: hypothetical protein V4493_02805 [Pseudomonadota bacterium]